MYATYLGGSEDDFARGIALDTEGNAYVTGATLSENFPVTVDALQTELAGHFDAFVSKVEADGTALLFSSFLGGGSSDYGLGIAVDSDGSAYVTGVTGSTGFPTLNAASEQLRGDDLLGFDAFVSKLNAQGSELVYSTFLGGTGMDIGFDVAVDSSGNTYVAGETDSSDFPSIGAFQPANGGMSDGFVVRLDPDGSTIGYSTYLGGSDRDSVVSIALDAAGDAYVTGSARRATPRSPSGPSKPAVRALRMSWSPRSSPERRRPC